MSSESFNPLTVNFLKQDTRFILKQAVSESLPYISQSTCNSRSCTPPSAKPPIHRINPTYSSTKELQKPKSYDNIILEQTKLIEKLQAQVHKLQTQVSPKSKSYIASPIDSDIIKINTETNTTFSIYQTNRLKSSKKILFSLDEKIDERAEEKKPVYVSGKFNHPKLSEKLPKINYKSSSESSDEENIKDLQVKYLKNNKK